MDVTTKYAHLEPEKWAPAVAESFHDSIGTPIKRTVLPVPAQRGDRLELGGVPLFFDHAYLAFELPRSRYFNAVRDEYLIPCAMTLARYVDYLTPHSDEIILAPIDTPVASPEAGVRVWQTMATHKNSTVVSCGVYARDGGHYVCLELAIAAKLKVPPVDHADYVARTAEYLGLST